MKILNSNSPTRQEQLDKIYACELSGWEIAAITALCNFKAGGTGLRKYCDQFSNEGDKLFPFVPEIGEGLFIADYFKERSEKILLGQEK